MFVIFKRELRAIFLNIKNVVCLALLAAASGSLFVLFNMSTGYAEIYSVLSTMTLASAIVIPVLVCDTFIREKDSRTYISALPITAGGILLGKALAFLVSVLTANAPIFLFPIILGLKGGPSLGVAYPPVFMFILFECLIIALSLLFATLFKKLWKLWVVLYCVLVAAFLIGAVAILLPDTVNDIVRLISPFKQFDHTVFGTFDIASMLYYITFSALFLYIAISGTRRALSGVKPCRTNVKRTVVASLLAFACVVANISLVFVPTVVKQFDISQNRVYNISENTENYIKTLDKDVTIYLINASGQPILGNFIERYCELSDKITLKYINAVEDTELLAEYGVSDGNLTSYAMIVDGGERYRYITADQYFCYDYNGAYYDTLVFQSALNQYDAYYQAYINAGQTNSSEFQQLAQTYQAMLAAKTCIVAEDAMTEAIAYVSADEIPTIYFADGSGEQSTGNRLNLKTDKVPDDATLIVINTPKEDYGDAAVADLLNFTKRGGRLIALTNEANLEMPNLMRLLECYGISANKESLGDGLTAKIDSRNAAFTSGGFSEIILDGTYELVSKNIDGIEVSPLLTVNVTVPSESNTDDSEADAQDGQETDKKEESAVSKAVGMISYENDIPKLLWISGGASFYKSTDELNSYDPEKEETQKIYANYSNLLSFLQISMLAMKENFDSGLSYPTPRQYNTDLIAVDAGDATLMGALFTVIYPLIIAGASFMLYYTRKQKSRTALEQLRQNL